MKKEKREPIVIRNDSVVERPDAGALARYGKNHPNSDGAGDGGGRGRRSAYTGGAVDDGASGNGHGGRAAGARGASDYPDGKSPFGLAYVGDQKPHQNYVPYVQVSPTQWAAYQQAYAQAAAGALSPNVASPRKYGPPGAAGGGQRGGGGYGAGAAIQYNVSHTSPKRQVAPKPRPPLPGQVDDGFHHHHHYQQQQHPPKLHKAVPPPIAIPSGGSPRHPHQAQHHHLSGPNNNSNWGDSYLARGVARPVEYQPHSIQEYREKFESDGKVWKQQGKLGPSVDEERLAAQRAKREKALEYAKDARDRARAGVQKDKVPQVVKDDAQAKDRVLQRKLQAEKRNRALEFAAHNKLRGVRPSGMERGMEGTTNEGGEGSSLSPHHHNGHPHHHDYVGVDAGDHELSDTIKRGHEIQRLENEHDKLGHDVAALRAEFAQLLDV